MPRNLPKGLVYEVVELEGIRYAILAEVKLRDLCQRAAVQASASGERGETSDNLAEIGQLDGPILAAKLVARRKRVGLSQARLAREAGVRVETLNRIERGKVTPDFATIRKLVTAIKAAEIVARD